MKPAVFLFLSSFLLIVARAERKYKIWQAPPEPTFDEYYRSMLNYNFEKMRRGANLSRTGKPLFPNFITIETLNVNETQNGASLDFALNNVTIRGFSNIFVDDFVARVYSKNGFLKEQFPIFELDVIIPTLELQGTYRFNGTMGEGNVECVGHFQLLCANILAGADILLKPSGNSTHGTDFEKVQITYVTGEIKEKIGITGSVCKPKNRVVDGHELLYSGRQDELMASVKVPLVEKFQEIIREGLNYTLSWYSYYTVLFGEVLN